MKTYIVSFEIPHVKLETIVGLLSGEIDHFNVREKDAEPTVSTSIKNSRNYVWTTPIRKKLRVLFDANPDKDFTYNGPEIAAITRSCGYNPSVASTALTIMEKMKECRRPRRGQYCSRNRKDG